MTQMPNGGQVAQRGFLIQTLIALLEALDSGKKWTSLTIEPNIDSDKVDILWQYSSGTKAVQVKSSQNPFSKQDIVAWATELETWRDANKYELILVGTPSSRAVASIRVIGKVDIPPAKNLDIRAFQEQAAQRIGHFLESHSLNSESAAIREMLAGSLITKLSELACKGHVLTRRKLTALLKSWIVPTLPKKAFDAGQNTTPLTANICIKLLKPAAAELLNSLESPPSSKDATAFVTTPPPPPKVFMGRSKDLEIVGRLLISRSQECAQPAVHVITAVRGLPGVGKTALAQTLAGDPTIRQLFPDGIHWIGLGHISSSYQVVSAMALLGSALGEHTVSSQPTARLASAHLSRILKTKKLLVILDDLTQSEHAQPFRDALPAQCSMLVTTRATGAAERIAGSDAIHALPPLDVEATLQLFEVLAPKAVAQDRLACAGVVNELGGLPLAIHVCASLLERDIRCGFDLNASILEIRNGTRLIEARAPADRLDYEQLSTPTVGALISTSVARLSEPSRHCFAKIAWLPPRPASFDYGLFERAMGLDDPKSTILELVDLGLLEPVFSATAQPIFQIHELLHMYAVNLRGQLA